MKGDKNEEINLVIPANIRFQHYGSWEKVKFENKFTAVPLRIPLHKDINKSFTEIAQITNRMKTQFGDVYATYLNCYILSMFAPYVVTNYFMNM